MHCEITSLTLNEGAAFVSRVCGCFVDAADADASDVCSYVGGERALPGVASRVDRSSDIAFFFYLPVSRGPSPASARIPLPPE